MKIIKSLALVLTVAIIAVGATQSFFGDTESSAGNTFTAGEIDLKVDNTTHYNGLVCKNDKWECEPWADVIVSEHQGKRKDNSAVLANRSDVGSALGTAETTGADSDPSPQPWTFYSLGFGGKVVIKFDNLVINGPNEDLMIYEVTGGSYPAETAEISVSQDGTNWTVLGTATRDEKFDLGSLAWIKYVKVKDNSDISLFNSKPDADGYDLDAIKALHCGAEPNLVGEDCDNMTWAETDLQNGIHKFFDFADIKPGDGGEDTVSLHVYDNDAWGRLKINVSKDEDDTCTEPEKEADENCDEDGTNNGELRENLDFLVWLDEGFLPGFQGQANDIAEGNNRLDQSEILLVSPGPIDEDGEEWSMADAIKASYVKNGSGKPGITADGHMVASTTYYFGMGWMLPMETGNEVQSDVFAGDIIFEVEQYRNNPNPYTD